jgi:hypothetical protein
MYEAIAAAGIRDTTAELAVAEPVLQTWRRRCDAQLELVGVCRSNSVFEMIPPVDPTSGISCPFRIVDAYSTKAYYVTPGCAVYIASASSSQEGLSGAFFDPCRLSPTQCDSTKDVTIQALLDATLQTRLPFDPRAVGARDAVADWPATFRGLSEEGNARQASARDALLASRAERTEADEIPWRLEPEFVAKVVSDGGAGAPGSVGNTRGAWGTSEGMGADAGEYCDGIADWWPEVTRPVLFFASSGEFPDNSP